MAEWRAKHLLGAAGALVVGLAVGGLGPRAEIRSLRARLAAAEEQAPPERDVGREIAQVFQGRPWEPPETPPPAPDAPADPPPAEPAGPVESLDAVRDAMDIRRTQARAALQQQADASDEQMASVDAIVADMNADLRDLATDLVERFRESEGEPERRELMMFAADTLDVLIGAEEALAEALTPGQREALDEQALDPLSYVDGSIVELLAEIDRP